MAKSKWSKPRRTKAVTKAVKAVDRGGNGVLHQIGRTLKSNWTFVPGDGITAWSRVNPMRAWYGKKKTPLNGGPW